MAEKVVSRILQSCQSTMSKLDECMERNDYNISKCQQEKRRNLECSASALCPKAYNDVVVCVENQGDCTQKIEEFNDRVASKLNKAIDQPFRSNFLVLMEALESCNRRGAALEACVSAHGGDAARCSTARTRLRECGGPVLAPQQYSEVVACRESEGEGSVRCTQLSAALLATVHSRSYEAMKNMRFSEKYIDDNGFPLTFKISTIIQTFFTNAE